MNTFARVRAGLYDGIWKAQWSLIVETRYLFGFNIGGGGGRTGFGAFIAGIVTF
jgi:hypothetical protein